MTKFYGIPAALGYQFRVAQWVMIYRLDSWGQPISLYNTTVQELASALADTPIAEFFIEPITPAGEPMSVHEALLPIYQATMAETCPLDFYCPVQPYQPCPNYQECRRIEPALTRSKLLRQVCERVLSVSSPDRLILQTKNNCPNR
jgi:hypothetical protein